MHRFGAAARRPAAIRIGTSDRRRPAGKVKILRNPDDPQTTGHRPALRRRKRRDEILADAATQKHPPRMPRGFPGRAAWRTLRPARVSAIAPPTQPQGLVIDQAAPADAEVGPGESDRPRWANLAILAVLVLLVVTGGVVWWFSKPAGQQRSAGPGPSAIFEQITLPGQRDARGGQMTVGTAADRNVLPDFESELLGQGGINEVIYAGSFDGQYTFLLYAYPSAGPEAARARTETVAGIHDRLGLKDAQIGNMPGGVPAVGLRNARASVMRTLYTSDSFTVQLSVLQKPAGDENALHAEFRRIVTLVASVLPPEPRGNAGG
jgi:hypothetical protein